LAKMATRQEADKLRQELTDTKENLRKASEGLDELIKNPPTQEVCHSLLVI